MNSEQRGHRVAVTEFANRDWGIALAITVGLMLMIIGGATTARGQEFRRGTSVASTVVSEGQSDPASTDVEPVPADSTGEGAQSVIGWIIRGSGYIGLIILFMSFYLFALVVWMFLHYRAAVAVPRGMVEELEDLLDRSRFKEAYERLAEDDSFLAQVLRSGVRKLPNGLDPARRAMELANEDVTMQMEHRTTYLATVGTLGPMIGLVGTVYGMIKSFQVIAQAGASPQASDLAAGISTALFATLEGIAISIPAIYFYAMFRNRIARLSLEVGMMADPLLERFGPGVQTSRPAPSTGAGPSSTSPPSPSQHAHPFAVNAAIAAGSAQPGSGPLRAALPSSGSSHADD